MTLLIRKLTYRSVVLLGMHILLPTVRHRSLLPFETNKLLPANLNPSLL